MAEREVRTFFRRLTNEVVNKKRIVLDFFALAEPGPPMETANCSHACSTVFLTVHTQFIFQFSEVDPRFEPPDSIQCQPEFHFCKQRTHIQVSRSHVINSSFSSRKYFCSCLTLVSGSQWICIFVHFLGQKYEIHTGKLSKLPVSHQTFLIFLVMAVTCVISCIGKCGLHGSIELFKRDPFGLLDGRGIAGR